MQWLVHQAEQYALFICITFLICINICPGFVYIGTLDEDVGVGFGYKLPTTEPLSLSQRLSTHFYRNLAFLA